MPINRSKTLMSILALFSLTSCSNLISGTDSERTEFFQAHKSGYEAVLAMLQHDQTLTFINQTVTDPGDPSAMGISKERLADYRRQMSEIDCVALRYSPALGSALFVSKIAGAANVEYFAVEQQAKQSHVIASHWYLSSASL